MTERALLPAATGKPHPLVVYVSPRDGSIVVQGLDWQIDRLIAAALRHGIVIAVDATGLCG